MEVNNAENDNMDNNNDNDLQNHPLIRLMMRSIQMIPNNTYIDTAGNPFIYEKTMWCKLKYYSIRNVEQKIVACVLHLDGVKAPFTIPRPPHSDMLWAGILHLYDLPWMLYEYSETKVKDSKRKV